MESSELYMYILVSHMLFLVVMVEFLPLSELLELYKYMVLMSP